MPVPIIIYLYSGTTRYRTKERQQKQQLTVGEVQRHHPAGDSFAVI
jgi:hypothetical protein